MGSPDDSVPYYKDYEVFVQNTKDYIDNTKHEMYRIMPSEVLFPPPASCLSSLSSDW